MVERIRTLLTDEAAFRDLAATDASFNVLCQEYREVIKLLDRFETEVEQLAPLRASTEIARLTHLRVSLEEQLENRIKGYEPR